VVAARVLVWKTPDRGVACGRESQADEAEEVICVSVRANKSIQLVPVRSDTASVLEMIEERATVGCEL